MPAIPTGAEREAYRLADLEDQQRASDGRALLEALESDSPNAQQIEAILDRSSSTDEGLDVLSTVAAIRARRRSILRLTELMEAPTSLERSYQELFDLEPWMLGSQYRIITDMEQTLWFGARADLLLVGALGYVDVVELKLPAMRLLSPSEASRGRSWKRGSTQPQRTWKQSAELSEAQSQAERYLDLIDEHREQIEARLGLSIPAVSRLYKSSVIIVAGRQPEDLEARNFIRRWNAKHPRIVLMTYDEVVAVAEATVALFERRLTLKTSEADTE